MNKILIIDNCGDCPFFDNQYYTYEEKCTQLNRVIQKNKEFSYNIPDDCPLSETDEEVTD